MIIKSEKDVLLTAVNIVSKAVAIRSTMPILGCILLSADSSSGIKFSAYDNEMGIVNTITEKSEVLEEGKVALESRIFMEIIRKIEEDEEIKIETVDSVVRISSANSEFKLQSMDPDLFPKLPMASDNYSITLSQFKFKELLKDTIFSIASNDSNKMMTGELLEISNDELKATSLDGHRISIKKVSLDKEYSPRKAIVPGKTLSEISKLLSDDVEDTIELNFEPNQIMFRFDNTYVTSRLIEGEYFYIDSMLSSDYDTLVKINKKSFTEAMERATIFVRETERKPLIMKITDKVLNLRMNTSMGSFTSNLPIVKDGNDLMIGFNPSFILDVLRVIDEEEVSLYFTSPKAPCFIRDIEDSYIYLILPINFNPDTYED